MALSDKQLALQETIQEYTNMLTKLNEAKSFYERNHNNFDNFEIKEFPLYEVVEMFDYGTSLEKYKKSVLPNIDKNQDIMSSLARIITFDNTKLLGSGMCVKKLASSNEKKKNIQYLESGKCIYTTIISDNKDETLSETLFHCIKEWAISNSCKLKGMAYIFINFIKLEETNIQLHEVWIPIE